MEHLTPEQGAMVMRWVRWSRTMTTWNAERILRAFDWDDRAADAYIRENGWGLLWEHVKRQERA